MTVFQKIYHLIRDGKITLNLPDGRSVKLPINYSLTRPVDPEKFNDAQRLISSTSPTGSVIWQEDFQDPVLPASGKLTFTANSDGIGYISKVASLRGHRCMRLVAGNAASNLAEYLQVIGKVKGARFYGFEGWFEITTDNTAVLYYVLGIEDRETLSSKRDGWVYLWSNGRVDIATGAASIKTLSAKWNFNSVPYWHHFKVVIDTVNKAWVSLVIDNQDFEVGGVPTAVDTVGGQDQDAIEFFIEIIKNNTDTSFRSFFVADLIGTIED